MSQPSIKIQKRRFVFLTIAYMLLMSAMFVYFANKGIQRGLVLKARNISPHLGYYRNEQLGPDGHFVHGMTGDLYWQPRTLTESMLLITADGKNIDLLDLLGFLIVACIMFFMFKDSDDSRLFTKNVTTGFLALVFVVGMSGAVLDMARTELSRNYVAYATHHQFEGTYMFKAISFNYMVYPLLMFLTMIPKKGMELQREAELTI